MARHRRRGLDHLQPLSATHLPYDDDQTRKVALRCAIVRTLVYADLFDYPLGSAEIQRYLAGCVASLEEVASALATDAVLGQVVQRSEHWFHLEGRAELAQVRRERAATSRHLWPVARRFGGIVARLPFVHLVAVTGALAVDNAPADDDVDLFLLVSPGRLWLSRLLVLVVVRWAASQGYELCPNYLLTTNRLLLDKRNFFTAHEVVQMVPLEEDGWYRSFVHANRWVGAFLPNAVDRQPTSANDNGSMAVWPGRLAAAVLSTPLFEPVEQWERQRKVRRLNERARREGGSVAFSADECRGHFGGHDQRILAIYQERVAEYEAALGNGR